MFGTPWKKFIHPAEVYNLEYPAHWDQVQQDEARSCGFGPHERDDVGLWISILPMSVDTERLAEEIPKLMNQMLAKSEAVNPRQDATLKHTGEVLCLAISPDGRRLAAGSWDRTVKVWDLGRVLGK